MTSADAAFHRPSDRWVARGISLGLHLCLLGLFGRTLWMSPPKTVVIFSVETVSGITPLGEGSGAQGTASKISDKPANHNPLAGGLSLGVTDAPVAAPKAVKAPKALKRPVVQAPSLKDLSQRYQDQGLRIGVSPRDQRTGDELSEGGMGNARHAGTESGALGLDGPIAGRGYRCPDYSYGKPLPEESEVVLSVTVGPKGEVIEAQVKKTSGYPELDQHALAKAREIVFDALPPGMDPTPVVGTVSFRFEYSGKAK